MRRRVGAWLVAAAVTVAVVAAGVSLAGGRRPPATLPPLASQPPASAGLLPRPSPPAGYRVAGRLPDLPGRARAWTVGADLDAGRLAAVAAALGVAGPPRADQTGWTVGQGARALRLRRAAGLPWSYGRPLVLPCRPVGAAELACRTLEPAAAAVPCPAGGARPPGGPVLGCPPVRPAGLPSRQQAERTARDLAARAGLDLRGAAVTVQDGAGAWAVTIAPAVDGRPTANFGWTVRVGPAGRVQAASGFLAVPRPADSYPLIGVAAAVERLRRQRPVGPPVASGPTPPEAVVSGVELGLALTAVAPAAGRPAGVAYLLPAYLFRLEPPWPSPQPVLAVQDRYVSPPPPTAVPLGRPSG